MVDTGAIIHHSKYWMPIHYDTIEDGQNKNLIFYSLNESPCFSHYNSPKWQFQIHHTLDGTVENEWVICLKSDDIIGLVALAIGLNKFKKLT